MMADVATTLDREQLGVLQELLRAGQAIKDPRARRVYERAAVQTGLVESGLRNLNHGDADSLGWRQERSSLYSNPTNVRASAARFRDEFLQFYKPGMKSYDVAWRVQRPREDLRGRYQQEAQDAAAILARYGGGAAPSAPSSSTSAAPSEPGSPLGGGDPGAAQSVAGTIASLMSQQQRPAPATSTLQAPSFAAKPAMAGAVVQGGAGPAPRADIGALIDATRTPGAAVAGGSVQGPSLTDVAGSLPASKDTPKVSGGVVPMGGSKNAGKGAFTISGPSPDRLQDPLVSFARKAADIYGGKFVGLDGSTHSKYTVNGNVSAHYTGNATDVFTIDGKPATGARLIRAGRAALIAAGMPREQALKAPGGLYNVGGYQIIFGVDGAANGGNHKDHLHIGRRPR